ncbi:helix-turn-helix domain-containing protein [Geomicrobium sp. JCM 19039]|uniref:helix-turn-helix domain-containing protein n=1 Tax=Geomicrobium sp. JCM 19039 TaxID=1460636 RepID=UPI00045F1EFC|nr:helix-turn-helix transcriptional regulator [Geomicrobium sp. JCM 19039]GAK12206.1 transcriptional regulator [Geomicrobium sp. JCM 19039]
MNGVVVVIEITAKRLRHLRETRGLSQTFVAEKIGVKNNTLSGYESGRREPDSTTLNKLADFYEVTSDYLLGRSDVKNFDETDVSIFASGGFMDVGSEEKKRKVEAFLRILEEEEEKEEKKKK